MGEVTCPECGREYESADGFYLHWPQVHDGRAPVVSEEYRHRDPELLRELYHERGLSIQKIADELGKNYGTIQVWMDRFDIDTPLTKDIERRFNNRYRVDESTGCWEWTGYVKKQTGYGELSVNGENEGAHRVSYELHNGEIPDGAFICHKCHNQSCVNPDHLYAGDTKSNAQDAIENGDWPALYGENQSSTKLTEEEVKEIRRIVENAEMSYKEIADEFGTSVTNVHYIVHRKTWDHI